MADYRALQQSGRLQRDITKQRCSSSNAARAINARAAEKNREAADSSVIGVREFIADSSTSPPHLKQGMYDTYRCYLGGDKKVGLSQPGE